MDNREALGYMLVALKELGYDQKTAKKIYGEMYYQFDLKTEDEADKIGHDWYYSAE